MTFQVRHLALALVLHSALFVLLAGGVQCSRKIQVPLVIEAVLLDPSRQEVTQRKRQEEKRRKEEEEARRKQELEQKRLQAEAEKKRQAEQEAKQKAEAERKKKDELVRAKKELDQKKKAEEQARVKKEKEEQLEKERQERRSAETKEQMQREIEQETMRQQMEQEARARAHTAQEAEFAKWISRVGDKVQRNWIRPPSVSENESFECKVLVKQLPGGQIASARIAENCGTPALHDSVVKAVLRSDPLPTVSDPALFQPEFTFVFVP